MMNDGGLHTSIVPIYQSPSQVDEAALEEDFDPATWDQQMAQAFGEEYYEQVDLASSVCLRGFVCLCWGEMRVCE